MTAAADSNDSIKRKCFRVTLEADLAERRISRVIKEYNIDNRMTGVIRSLLFDEVTSVVLLN